MKRNEDNIIKDQLRREEKQEPEESLEYETKALPLTLPFKFLGQEFFFVGEICNTPRSYHCR